MTTETKTTTTKVADPYYYHAGVSVTDTHTRWSSHTRRTRSAAECEARRMAAAYPGSTPIVECWDRSHGLAPGYDVAVDAWEAAR